MTVAAARKVARMLNGESVGYSSFPVSLAEELLEEGVLVQSSYGRRGSYRICDVEGCRTFLAQRYSISGSLEEWIEMMSRQEAVSRAEQVAMAGNSKVRKIRGFKGFLVNSYSPIEAILREEPLVIEPVQGTSIFIEDYELQIPCDWMIKSVYSYQKADQPVLRVDVLDFDEEQLKQEYGYQSKEECLVHFMPNGVYEQERKEAEAADHLKGWQLKCTADRYSEEEGAFVVSDEPVYLDFLVDDEKEKLYLFYFMNDMAEESEITSFLQNMKENGAQESEDGMYRWMIED
mgnify:CR=1 FL=1